MKKFSNEKVAICHYSTAGFCWPSSNEIFNLYICWQGSIHGFKQESEEEEIEMLERYSAMIAGILEQGGRIVHYNQNSSAYGVEHLKARYEEIGSGKPLSLTYGADNINLSWELIQAYGNDYADHPRLDYLAEINNFSGVSTDYPSVVYDMERAALILKIWYAAINGTLKTRDDLVKEKEFDEQMLKRLRSELRGEPNGNDLLTRDEAIDLLQISRSTMTNWLRDGTLNHIKIGRRVYLQKSEILKSNSIQTQ